MAVERHVEDGLVSPEFSPGEGCHKDASFFPTLTVHGGNARGQRAKSGPPHFHTLYYY